MSVANSDFIVLCLHVIVLTLQGCLALVAASLNFSQSDDSELTG